MLIKFTYITATKLTQYLLCSEYMSLFIQFIDRFQAILQTKPS